nr:nucleoside-diphosphate sugar epimerase/dehydratase [Enterococcus faecalis]
MYISKQNKKINFTRRNKIELLILWDVGLIFFSYIITTALLDMNIILWEDFIFLNGLLSSIFYCVLGFLFHTFTQINRFISYKELLLLFVISSIQITLATISSNIFTNYYITLQYRLVNLLVIFFLLSGTRLMWYAWIQLRNTNSFSETQGQRIIIIGAGDGGRRLAQGLEQSCQTKEIQIIGFLDDDIDKRGTYISGIKILGSLEDISIIVNKYEVDVVVIAIPSLKKNRLREIIGFLQDEKVKISTIPSVKDLVMGDIVFKKLKQIEISDLLGRDEVSLNTEKIKKQITGKVVLITGAGGSIGSEISHQVIQFNPNKLILFGHGENSIYQITRKLNKEYMNTPTEIIPIIADIQDKKRVDEIIKQYRPNIIYHAAAHKHVPLMEYNPTEAMKNNVYGTLNVAQSAKKYEVNSFVMISSDKANRPPNVMGATKRIAEMIITGLNEPGSHTKLSAVRFGNVLGSRGSVVPIFKEQISEGGPVKVTDFRMTRYFMSIPEASRLVIQAGVLARGGEIFVLDMGSQIKIVDLAETMIQLSGYSKDEIEIIETGIRPGEKLYEELLLDKEKSNTKIFDKIFVGNINGFSFEEVIQFIQSISLEDTELSEKLIAFANASSE